MEQKRRTIRTNSKKVKGKKIGMIIAIILGLAIIFWVSFKISYGFFSTETPIPNDKVLTTEEEISGMPRKDLEEKYLKLKDALKDKEAELEMLEKKLNDTTKMTEDVKDNNNKDTQDKETPTKTPPPETKPTTPSAPPTTENNTPQTNGNGSSSEVTPNAPPPATSIPDDKLISPEDLEKAAQKANQ